MMVSGLIETTPKVLKNALALCCLLILIFGFLGCSSTQSNKMPQSTLKLSECTIEPNVVTKGQIRYFREMQLKVRTCPNYIRFEFENKQALLAVLSVIDLESPRVAYSFVDLHFLSTPLPDGTVEIYHVEYSAVTDSSIF